MLTPTDQKKCKNSDDVSECIIIPFQIEQFYEEIKPSLANRKPVKPDYKAELIDYNYLKDSKSGYDRLTGLPVRLSQTGLFILDGDVTLPDDITKDEVVKVLKGLSGCQELFHGAPAHRFRQLSAFATGSQELSESSGGYRISSKNSSQNRLGAFSSVLSGLSFSHPDAECRPYDEHDANHLVQRVNEFFPERGRPTEQIKAKCIGCKAVLACLEFSLTDNIKHGIWGGMSERERRHIRRIKNQQSPQAARNAAIDKLKVTAKKLNMSSIFQSVLDSEEVISPAAVEVAPQVS